MQHQLAMQHVDIERLAEVFAEERPTTKLQRLDVLADEPRPFLRVITTPPELRAQWQRYRTIRQALMLAIAIAAALVTFGVLV
jgi:hypothetical protein